MIYSPTKRKRYRHSQRKTKQTDTEGELYNYANTEGKIYRHSQRGNDIFIHEEKMIQTLAKKNETD